MEDRDKNSEVGKMASSVVGVIEKKHIAAMYFIDKGFCHRTRRPGHCANMNRNMFGLSHKSELRIDDCTRKVA